MLENGSNETGDLFGWTIVEEDQGQTEDNLSGWNSSWGLFGDRGLTTSIAYNRRSQLIDLVAAGHTKDYLDCAPPIAVREWYIGVAPIFEDAYFLRAELQDEQGGVMAAIELGSRDEPLVGARRWQVADHVFEDYGPGVRFVYLEDGARGPVENPNYDLELLRFELIGPYMGTRLDGAAVVVGSVEMRISNNKSDWSAWMPFAPQLDWTLDATVGQKTVYVEFRDTQGQQLSARGSVTLENPS